MKKIISLSIVAMLALTGCVDTNTLGSDVYDVNDLNTQQDAKTVQILSIMPAKVAVDNTEAKRTAQGIGTLLGAVGGAILGNKMGGRRHETGGTVAGGTVGAAGGYAAGSMVKDKVVVEGVTIAYKQGTKLKTSTQAGRMCQFKEGTALLISTRTKETRIQPNAVCPKEK
ncbi:glycine zipper 2TM domain-containing protein [Campylobacter sp. JMF_08 NE1]|uniref:glycine zipper 2TM domain-containing protein n=1 Tax=Campylobacter sp. JMF_08 NE1 TaxID=2983821 RepID=UPI0022E9B57B|nr:glycine zipper 2TM domain-containing protein [Campylobacter sp. JMF_08 NE1]MDA3047825.1 glycine zipper 2TM domain-containing protein [Campylobacter sp. JMF_08 NE1]